MLTWIRATLAHVLSIAPVPVSGSPHTAVRDALSAARSVHGGEAAARADQIAALLAAARDPRLGEVGARIVAREVRRGLHRDRARELLLHFAAPDHQA